jgi:hypothetical protein
MHVTSAYRRLHGSTVRELHTHSKKRMAENDGDAFVKMTQVPTEWFPKPQKKAVIGMKDEHLLRHLGVNCFVLSAQLVMAGKPCRAYRQNRHRRYRLSFRECDSMCWASDLSREACLPIIDGDGKTSMANAISCIPSDQSRL